MPPAYFYGVFGTAASPQLSHSSKLMLILLPNAFDLYRFHISQELLSRTSGISLVGSG
jgi:hypothetical protein